MMQYYFVKESGIGPIPKGSVERFASEAAARWLRERPGSLELFDEKRHGSAPGAEHAIAMDRVRTGR